ncbi:tetraacyldisaccharide 4'-kinase [Candidatus Nitrotoga sp. HW29]|uniref:tetraacyldisaccharide 4'-kinase n=1 Tax=Candidatus Nitrotoga sp. HW29 TaxID=2886963 RepID=UPI001EF19123|nr:tetraacyldisaccharide 4'-kinase [Candidatus Nitrotoga sp. HW29]CAH1905131.1 tetraacyldisaccharide 4'-kinase [Candidatus Nitrotoga sp. HW29]
MQWLEQHWYRIAPLHLILLPVSFIFRMLAAIRRTLYRTGILTSVKLPVPTIVVGNITVGGSGKTPLTLWLAQQLIDSGWHPGIISRGYGGTATSPLAVHASSSPDEAGDEAVLMAQRKLCPVWIGRDRVNVARALLQAHPECDIVLSDDGLQHYRLQRDFEIAVVDGVRRFGNGFLLPAGPLREPISRLTQVDAVVIHGGMATQNQHSMQLFGESFYNLLNPNTSAHAVDFYGQRLHSIAGIGHPQRFFSHLNRLGLKVQTHPFPDHHRFMPADLVYTDADAILMTEKDAVKCTTFANEKCWVLRVDAQLDSSLTQQILERLTPDGRQTA